MVKIAAALFEPDKSRFNMGVSQEILNAIPVTDGWAPMPGPSPFTPLFEILTDEDGNVLTDEDGNILVVGVDGADILGEIQLPSGSRGSFYARLTDGTVGFFTGTTTTLYRFDFNEYTWVDVSGPSAPYSVPDGYRWSFALYGDTVYCQNFSDPEQMFDLGSDSAFSDNATAPICAFLVVIANFLHRLRLLDDQNSSQWSGLDDPTVNVIGERLSDVQPYGDGNGVQGGVSISSGAVIFLRDKIDILSYPDPEYLFRRSDLTNYRGTNAPYSICSIGQDDFVFYAADGFFRGAAMQPIGAQRVDKWVLDNVTETARAQMISAPDYRRKIVWFRMEVATGGFLVLGYHWQLDRWCPSNIDLQDMFRIETPGLTIDGLGNLYDTFDDIDIPFDSSAMDGGSVEFGGITSDGYLAFINGDPLEATLTTNEASLNDTSNAFVNRGRLDSDATDYSVVIMTAEYKGGSFRDREAVTPSARTKSFTRRANGRVHKFRVVIPAGENWTIYQGVDIGATGSGES